MIREGNEEMQKKNSQATESPAPKEEVQIPQVSSPEPVFVYVPSIVEHVAPFINEEHQQKLASKILDAFDEKWCNDLLPETNSELAAISSFQNPAIVLDETRKPDLIQLNQIILDNNWL